MVAIQANRERESKNGKRVRPSARQQKKKRKQRRNDYREINRKVSRKMRDWVIEMDEGIGVGIGISAISHSIPVNDIS